jgi:hypothetical protein
MDPLTQVGFHGAARVIVFFAAHSRALNYFTSQHGAGDSTAMETPVGFTDLLLR